MEDSVSLFLYSVSWGFLFGIMLRIVARVFNVLKSILVS